MAGKSHGRAREEGGQILVITALILLTLLGVAAVTIDGSLMYEKRNRLYAAADAAAKSAALELSRASLTRAQLEKFADQQVAFNGFSPSRLGGTTSVVVNGGSDTTGPQSGPFIGNNKYVEVIVSQATNTFFGRVFQRMTMTPGARSVAASNDPNPNCIIALKGPPGSSPYAMHFGTSVLTMPGCWIASAGDLDLQGMSNVTAKGVTVTAAAHVGGGSMSVSPGTIQYSIPAPSDPLLGKLVAPNPFCAGGVGAEATSWSGSLSLLPGCYHNITIPSGGTLTLLSGEFKITGDFLAPTGGGSPRTLLGSHVLIFLASTANMQFTNNQSRIGTALAPLTAQTSGANKGIVLWSDSPRTVSLSGNSGNYNMSGGMYVPKAALTFANNIDYGNDACMLIVAFQLSIGAGNSKFSSTCSSYGGSPLVWGGLAE